MNRRHFQTQLLAATLLSSGVRGQTGKPRIAIGQIGTRHAHADGQLLALRSGADFDVVGVVAEDDAAWAAVRNRPAYQGLPRMSQEELLAVPGIAAVNVETPVKGLLDAAEAVVDAGLHLGLDKPAGESLPQFRRILKKADAQNKLVKMGYMFRYNPAFELAARAIKEGWLGPVSVLHAEMSKQLVGPAREELKGYPGGSMFELGCHLIDSVVRFLGAPDRVTPFLKRAEEDGIADNMTAVLEYPGTLVTLRSSLREVTGGPRRQMVISGDKGTLEILPLEPPQVKLTLLAAEAGFKKGSQAVPIAKRERYEADWKDFAAAIRGEKAWEFTSKHDLAVQETILRASGLPVD
jgi:predicted dehydrogenase